MIVDIVYIEEIMDKEQREANEKLYQAAMFISLNTGRMELDESFEEYGIRAETKIGIKVSNDVLDYIQESIEMHEECEERQKKRGE